ncbi:MAG: magnesium-translocating P-type ATPase [Candidatus Liptonbacteria bacterium]|nr:magnesium-translocating P-type ATPase [Candidatus Liptonbacteria bacterium]
MNYIYDLKTLSSLGAEDIFRSTGSGPEGLTAAEATGRLKVCGPNEIKGKKKLAPVWLFFSKFNNPILLLLLAAAVVSGFLSSPISAVIIVVMVFASVIVDFVSTYKSDKAIEDLREQVNVTATVFRSGKKSEHKVQKIVPGDVFELSAGDMVPADSLIIESNDLFSNESSLTGESTPVEKTENATPEQKILWMGTSIISGAAKAIVAKTGLKTRFGEIAGKLQSVEEKTEFDKNISEFSRFLFWTATGIIAVIFLLNVFLGKKNILEVFIFAVAVVIGLSPELLPVIITTNLAKGALRISKKGAIVRKLSSIHNLGSIDVLCSDKTGTLTEDRIALMKYVDFEGKESDELLLWGYLGSVYHTGIHNTLNNAILNYKKLDVSGWEKLDEVPFDAERRRDSVAVKNGNEAILIAKGAPESMLAVSAHYGEENQKLTEEAKIKILKVYEDLSRDGFRVLGLAVKKGKQLTASYSKEDESEMTFLGFLAFLDPPKKSAKDTLSKLAEYNVQVKIITGDNALVTEKIAREIGLKVTGILEGGEINKMSDKELAEKVDEINIFSRVLPEDKERIVRALRSRGRVVGYLGDGVNDVLALRAADVGISVNNAVDIAKDTADIILLNRGLEEIIEAIIEGRKTFANLFKYMMIALSSNFGNMMSMPVGSLFLPFLPMASPQILLNNFIYDGSQFSIPFDSVDPEFLKKAKKFDLGFMKRFMIFFGPLSSVFDVATFLVFFYVFRMPEATFQTAWFMESIASQALVVNIIRSFGKKISRPGLPVLFASVGAVVVAWIIPFTPIGSLFVLRGLPITAVLTIIGITAIYLGAVAVGKGLFYKKWGALIER